MPAFPFGGHPTLADYTAWARTLGCVIECGVVLRDGHSVRITRIVAPSGKFAVDIGTDDHERLVPTTVARLDRRLDLDSPFAKVSIED